MRTLARRHSPGILLALTAAALLAPVEPGWAKPRAVLVLPFAAVDLSREEQWLGEAVAQSLQLALATLPGVVEIDRARLRQLPKPEAWDEPAALLAARSVKADIALYGEVRRTAGDLSLQPRYLEVRGERAERGALEARPVAEGALLEGLRGLPLAYARALKIAVADAEATRLAAAASPTTSLKAWEAFVRARQATARGTQEGHEAAVELLARALEADAHFVVAQYTLGLAHQALGNRWKAAAQFRASTQQDPTYPEPYKALGDMFLTQPRRLFDQALEAYGKALELRPFFAEAHVGLGDARAAKGDVDGAVTAYQKALVYNPLNPRVHVSLGRLLYGEKGLYFEAVTAYKRAIELDPGYVDARMGLAEVYEDKGLYQEAIGEYRRVVEQDARHTGALYNLALVYEKVDIREAVTLWERYIQLASLQPSEKDWVDVARLHLRKLRNQLDRGN